VTDHGSVADPTDHPQDLVPDPATEPGAGPVPVRRRTRPTRSTLVLLAFPMVVLALSAVLAGLNLNGSSVALLDSRHASDRNVVAGQPRNIRTDEFGLATPFQVGNVGKGFPAFTWIGLTDTDLTVAAVGAPIRSWVSAFEPTTWPYFVLSTERAFALRWWSFVAASLIGTYVLLVALRRRPALAATLAVVVGVSPAIAWWSNGPGPIIGFLSGAAAAVVLAGRARLWWVRVGLSLLAGYLGCVAFFILYPPWLISVGLVMAAVVVGDALQHRATLRGFALAVLPALAVVVAVVAVWGRQSAAALAAVTGTHYPGSRVSEAGTGLGSVLFGTALNPIVSNDPTSLLPAPQLNQSEVSSAWFPLPALALLVGIVVALIVITHRRRAAAPSSTDLQATGTATSAVEVEDSTLRGWATFIAVACVMVLEVLWTLVPLPAVVGRITLLDRVPGGRMELALGMCTVLLVHLAAGRVPLSRPWRRAVAIGAVAVASGALAWWSASQLLRPGTSGVLLCAVSAVVVTACLGVLVVHPRAWLAALVVASIVVANYVIVNPLYRGLGPLTRGTLARTLQDYAAREGGTRWVDLAPDGSSAVIAASPQELLSGMTYYPTKNVWERLAPTQELLWNNFAKYVWKQDPSAQPATILQVKGSVMRLTIDLCSPDVRFLDISYVLSTPTVGVPPCFTTVQTVKDLGRTYLIARRT
jgi:hypothetical protein